MPVVFTAGSSGFVNPVTSVTLADGYVRYATAPISMTATDGTVYFLGSTDGTGTLGPLMTDTEACGAGNGMMVSNTTADNGASTMTSTCTPVCTYVVASEANAVLQFVQGGSGISYFHLTLTASALPPDLTDAEALYYQATQAAREWSRRWRELEWRWQREGAARRAGALLHAHLTPEQRADYAQFGAINVVSLSHRRYRIRKGGGGNVDLYGEDGRIQHRLCIHPGAWVPDADTMLAQLLMIRFDEEEFLRIANFHPPLSEDREATVLAQPLQQAG